MTNFEKKTYFKLSSISRKVTELIFSWNTKKKMKTRQ